ncbi:hypothetical protein ADU37_CDS18270 [Thermococcus sp. 2319x1]|nr:hypothetical protein ADU37_CDS18270 [Thermococcus sp. 2319x1]
MSFALKLQGYELNSVELNPQERFLEALQGTGNGSDFT